MGRKSIAVLPCGFLFGFGPDLHIRTTGRSCESALPYAFDSCDQCPTRAPDCSCPECTQHAFWIKELYAEQNGLRLVAFEKATRRVLRDLKVIHMKTKASYLKNTDWTQLPFLARLGSSPAIDSPNEETTRTRKRSNRGRGAIPATRRAGPRSQGARLCM